MSVASWTECLLLHTFRIIMSAGLKIEPKYQIDIIDGLHVFNATYRGLTLVEGFHKLSPAVKLIGYDRQLLLPPEVYDKAAGILSQNNEFTLMITIKQKQKNTGTIFGFSEGNNRFLEIQSSGRKDEIRLHYTHNDVAYTETFRYRLADDKWHQVAISVSGNSVDLFVDCNRIYRRVILDIDRNISAKNTSLWLGQRNLRHFFFQGVVQDAKIIGRSHGYTIQCPHLDTECPTCGQFRHLQMSVLHLENYVKLLTERLAQAEKRLASVEECECKNNCHVNGTIHLDGFSWEVGCEVCSCLRGKTTCHHKQCNATSCKNPVQLSGKCCPTCLKKCLMDGKTYDHGEEKKLGMCQKCYCNDGTMNCERIQECPPLPCSEEDSFFVEGECCKVCKGVDYCSKHHDCHINAKCINLHTRYTCHCNPGYEGDGKNCQEKRQILVNTIHKNVNECLQKGGHTGHHCHDYTKCVNVPGSYVCECLPGYGQVDHYYCTEINECVTGEHDCDVNAICNNNEGSYTCQCKEGYVGNGYLCQSVCNQTCLNGGQCVAPGICSCRQGYTGPSCELDIDECKLGIHECHPNSECVNMPGWYYCHCRPGYESHFDNNYHGVMCQDINECMENTHTCHGSAVCINKNGSYICECQENSTCSLSCLYYGSEKLDGETWLVADSTCTECVCKGGVVTCKKQECDCSRPDIDLDCCPNCDFSSYCHHQEVPRIFCNGERWVYQCEVCECLFGEIDCWELECPPVTCDHPVRHEGDCCHRCADDICSSQTFSRDEVSGNITTNLHHDHGCTYRGHLYQSGEQIPIGHDPCTTCNCKDGHLCCTYTPTCLANTDNPGILPSMDKQMHISSVFFHTSGQHLFKKEKVEIENTSLFIEDIIYTSSPFSKLLKVAKTTDASDQQMENYHLMIPLKTTTEDNINGSHGNTDNLNYAKGNQGNKKEPQELRDHQGNSEDQDSGKIYHDHSKEWVSLLKTKTKGSPLLTTPLSESTSVNNE
ncbi:protein kinase C-binding protein NELL1-like isoform X3 [Tachypleus tridentatus]|uniref:protein kinase C-binding protein NELL1-like isoform X3 n=1 Tax=Tachypleus tridentatus TaxID=6853 RepID=UPI003FD1DA19